MPTKNSTLRTITETDNAAARRVQYGSLLALLLMEALYFLMEDRCNGILWTVIERYTVIPAMLFLGASLSLRPGRLAKRQLALAVWMLIWFCILQIQRRVMGLEKWEVGIYFCAYGLCLLFAAMSGDGKRQLGLKWILCLYMAVGALIVVYGLLLLAGAVPAYLQDYVCWNGTRFTAFSHPTHCAMLLMIGIGASLTFCAKTQKTALRVLLLLWCGVQFFMLVLTNGRTTLAFACALFGGSLFCGLRKTGWKRLWVACLAAVVLTGGLFFGSGALGKVHQIQMEKTPQQTEDNAPQKSWSEDMHTLNGRTLIWDSARKGLRDNPDILWVGTDYSGVIISQYNPFHAGHAHNSWIEILYQMGLPALLPALILTGAALYDVAVLLWYNRDLSKSILAVLMLCILGSAMLEPYLFVKNVVFFPFNYLFLLLLGYLDCWRAELRGKE